jgi:hypothetical protein
MSDPDMAHSGPRPESEWSGPSWTDQPHTVSPRRSRARFVVGVVAAAGVVLLTLALTRWLGLGPTLLDTGQVERDVAAQFEEEHRLSVELECPRRMEVSADAVYECTGTTQDGDEVDIEIRIADEDGAYTWLEV